VQTDRTVLFKRNGKWQVSAETIRFQKFEHVPADESDEGVLEMAPHPGARVREAKVIGAPAPKSG